MLHKVLKIGNSYGVTFPKDFVVKNEIKAGVSVDSNNSGGSITFSTKIPNATKYEAISDNEFLDTLKEVESKYGDALDQLANLK